MDGEELIYIAETAFKEKGVQLDDLTTRNLPDLCMQFRGDLKRNHLLRALLANMGTQYEDYQINTYSHYSLAQSYGVLGFYREAFRHMAMLLASSELNNDDKGAGHAQSMLKKLGVQQDLIAKIRENPTQMICDAFNRFKDVYGIPEYVFCDEEGEQINDPLENNRLTVTLETHKCMQPFDTFGTDYEPVAPNLEQQECIDLVVDEATKLLNAFGINTQRLPDAKKIIFLSQEDFYKLLKSPSMSKTEVSQLLGDELVADGFVVCGGYIYIDKEQDLWTLIHTLAHEVFGHDSAIHVFKSRPTKPGQPPDINVDRLGLAVHHFHGPNQPMTIDFEMLDEIFTEFVGYVLRLSLFVNQYEKLFKLLNEDDRNKLLNTFTSSVFTQAIPKIVEKIAKDKGISLMEALQIMIETYYTGGNKFYDAIRDAYTEREYEELRTLDFTPTRTPFLEKMFGFNVDMYSIPQDEMQHYGKNPMEEPLIKELLQFLNGKTS